VPAGKAKFFPVAPHLPVVRSRPASASADLGAIGQPFLSDIVLDEKRDSYCGRGSLSYPLFVCPPCRRRLSRQN